MSHPSNHIDPSSVKELFRYKAPTPDTIPRYNAVTAAASAFAEALLVNAPVCDFTKQAIQHVVLARMLANAAIANEPTWPDPATLQAKLEADAKTKEETTNGTP